MTKLDHRGVGAVPANVFVLQVFSAVPLVGTEVFDGPNSWYELFVGVDC